MDAETFLDSRQHPSKPQFQQWMWALLLKTASGIAILWLVARRIPARLPLGIQGWLGLFGFIPVLHFGSFDLIACFWQRIRYRSATNHGEPNPSPPHSVSFGASAGISVSANWLTT